ncbi:hypothetical protein IFM12275_13300 [Nocardia sputorum]|nr:hypothetical protein IFM12275_13300 [Nocardia sputorum]
MGKGFEQIKTEATAEPQRQAVARERLRRDRRECGQCRDDRRGDPERAGGPNLANGTTQRYGTEALQHAAAWFADHGVTIERVLSDNGSAYRSHAWREACDELRITHKRTRPYRPQTNGKIERFHRTLADGWAYAHFYQSAEHRNQALLG